LHKFSNLDYLRSLRKVVMKNNTFMTILQTFRKDLVNASMRTNICHEQTSESANMQLLTVEYGI
jgi:hypothetical protein